MRRILLSLVPWLFVSSLSLSSLLAAGGPPLPERFRVWLEEVDPLITQRERDAFLALGADADREAFVERFWEVRDPYPETPRNEARERWEARLAEVRSRWGGTRDDRSRVFLLNGEPDSILAGRCDGTALELWTYEPRFQVQYCTVLGFLSDPAGGPSRLWQPGKGGLDLVAAAKAGKCEGDARAAEAFVWIRRAGTAGCDVVTRRALTASRPREWVSELHPAGPAPAAAPAAAPVRRPADTLPARLAFDFPGRPGDGLVRVLVALDESVRNTAREMILSGRVLRGAQTVDAFRYRFDGLRSGSASQPLAFERRLQPGRYRLEVKMEAPTSGDVYEGERDLAVPADAPVPAPPALPEPPAAPVTAAVSVAPTAAAGGAPAVEPIEPIEPVEPEVRRLFAEADAELAAPRPGLRLAVPSGQLLAGTQSFEARVERAAGVAAEAQIERVAFALDGKPLLTRNHPPFTVQVDLGKVPRTHRLAAQGLDRGGRVLASDEAVLNAGAQRFAVHLAEPRPGRTYRQSLRARVDVDAPEDHAVDRVELYLGDQRVATLYQPPFVQPLVLPDPAAAGYVRAVAYLGDGTAAEDLVLLNTPAPAEKLDIRLVELYTNVGDRAGRPIAGLGAGDFQVFEDGARQTLRQVERVDDTPLRLVTLIDDSASMQPRLQAASRTALEFLRRTLRPKDQAAVITFNKAPHVAVGLTGDLAALAAGFDGLAADDETALWDSLIFSLNYLGGTSGQRAVLLLSDGEDRVSRFQFDDALESARRAGIAVYVMGIDLTRGEATDRLSRLAADTGGRSFFVKSMDELPGIYGAIEKDLRSRYRLTYQSSNTRPGEAFRAVRVKVDRPGVEARTISGYYP
ncbi:MAG TPA: VWA domain-containing protein [Thermoanaerobaculia bacterium]|nr:VWA domain-containing protein [Thermoanaerobaculia bacterium]